jgi:HEAT repeat protein
LEVATRALLLERAGELADISLDLDFGALGKLALDDPDPEVRERAVTTLWESSDTAVAERLADLAAHDPGSGVRAAAALGLGPFAEEVAMGRLSERVAAQLTEALRLAAEDADVAVRAAAVESIGPLPEDWVSERILEAYENPERELRIAALRAMGASALERWAEYISDQLYSGEPEFRLEAVLAAGALGSDSLVDALGETLQDEDPEVVLAAIEALGEIGGEEAVELLDEFAAVVPEGMEEALEEARSLAADAGMFRRFGEPKRDDHDEFDEDNDE